MKITVLKYGESTYGENYLLKGGRNDVKLPITFVFYLIETDAKKILVDVGCNDGAGFTMSIFQKPLLLLEGYGVQASEITDVIITHAHHDHIEAIRSYQKATIYIQKKEYEKAKKYIPKNFKVKVFEQEFFLGEQITVKKIGGHSEGSSIVICRTKDKNYILCGDECYIHSCFQKQIPTGSSYCPEISAQFIREYSGINNVPLLFHDPDILKGQIGHQVILDEI